MTPYTSCRSGLCVLLALLIGHPAGAAQPATLTGQLEQWHCITLSFHGPAFDEQGKDVDGKHISPFRDYRLTVTFTHAGGRSLVVPGFFAADGNAGETSATAGDIWRVHFMPDATGQWNWKASFRTGPSVAVADDPAAGEPAAFDGMSGSFTVGESDAAAPDLRAAGRLDYVGQRYLKFAGSGRYFLKAGCDSPENLLGYADFDGTRRQKVFPDPKVRPAGLKDLHHYAPHLKDWHPGDPSWKDGRGKGLIGALNYLSSVGVNSIYFITMNVNGDGQDVWPWIDETSHAAFDCSKLDQWEIVFAHMTRKGIMLHVLTQETENCKWLDGGELGPDRKLYYRELVARFAHHPALEWNLGEEDVNTTARQKAFADYIRKLDPYRHPIVLHTFPSWKERVYAPLLGFGALDGPSLQMGNPNDSHSETIKWVDRSQKAGHPWFVCVDEIGPADIGVKPDVDDPAHDQPRKQVLWGNLMGGGSGVEWYFGYKYPNSDLTCEDFRSRQKMWDQTRLAVDFFQQHLPFAQMHHADELVTSGAWCLAKPGEAYAVYLPQSMESEIDLGTSNATFSVRWFNPRTGGDLVEGSMRQIKGPGKMRFGLPPDEGDWVALIQKQADRAQR